MIHDCTDPSCSGRVDTLKKINVREFYPMLQCSVIPEGAPCDKCGRLHWLLDSQAMRDDMECVLYLKNGEVTGKYEPRKR